MKPSDFYDQLAPQYHEVYADWERSMARQAEQLHAIIRSHSAGPQIALLDASCGIGTQALGLASLGYEVTGSDISPLAVLRARREAKARKLSSEFRVAGMRKLWSAHRREFDAVISCDNSIPHLLSDKQILSAFRQMKKCTRMGGICLVTVRDYAAEERSGILFKPYGIAAARGRRTILFQTWEFHGSIYTVSMYRLEEMPGGRAPRASVLRTKYYAVSTAVLMRLMREAGFSAVRRLDGAFYQPVIVGKRRS